MMSRLNIVLAVLLVVVVMLTVVMRPDHLQPNFEFMPDMKYSPAPLAYAPSSVFANGRTLQAPVPGTIPRGAMPLHYEATKEDAVRAGEQLTNPYQEALVAEAALAATAAASEPAVDETVTNESASTEVATAPSDETTAETTAEATEETTAEATEEANEEANEEAAVPTEPEPTAAERLQASVQRGGETYRVFCITCHGPTGEGDGPVAKRGFPPPPPLPTGNSRMMKDGQLFHILTYGQGSMPRFAAELSPDDRWDMINYIRDIQPAIEEPAPSAETPEATPPAAETASEETASETDTADAESVE